MSNEWRSVDSDKWRDTVRRVVDICNSNHLEEWEVLSQIAYEFEKVVAAKDAEIEFLEKALNQAIEIVVRLGRDIYPDVTNQQYTCFDEWDDDNQCWGCGYTESPELAACLRKRVASGNNRPPESGVQSGVQNPEEGGKSA